MSILKVFLYKEGSRWWHSQYTSSPHSKSPFWHTAYLKLLYETQSKYLQHINNTKISRGLSKKIMGHIRKMKDRKTYQDVTKYNFR